MRQAARTQFIKSYSQALLQSWCDEDFAGQLDRNPREALVSVGMELPPGATIEIIRHTLDQVGEARRDGDVDKQVALYEAGLESGHFVFHMPTAPVVDTADLNAEELGVIAAGTTYCCCCCPACSSCTI